MVAREQLLIQFRVMCVGVEGSIVATSKQICTRRQRRWGGRRGCHSTRIGLRLGRSRTQRQPRCVVRVVAVVLLSLLRGPASNNNAKVRAQSIDDEHHV